MRQKQDFKLPCLRDGCREKGDLLGGAVVEDLPANAEKRIQSLGWEDPLEWEMAICSGILAWEILWTEEPGGLQSMGSQRVGRN